MLTNPREFEKELEKQRPPGEEQKEQYNAFLHGDGNAHKLASLKTWFMVGSFFVNAQNSRSLPPTHGGGGAHLIALSGFFALQLPNSQLSFS